MEKAGISPKRKDHPKGEGQGADHVQEQASPRSELRHNGFYLTGATEQNSGKPRRSFPVTEEHFLDVTCSAGNRGTGWFRAGLPGTENKNTEPPVNSDC